MLMENNLAYNTDYSKVQMSGDRFNRVMMGWKCPNCGEEHFMYIHELENFVDCDARNPSDEMWICPKCNYVYKHLCSSPAIIGSQEGDLKVSSDGDNLFLTDEEGRVWQV